MHSTQNMPNGFAQNTALQSAIGDAVARHKLPADFFDTVAQWYLMAANAVGQYRHGNQAALVVGVQGTQGSGKSTLADFLRILLYHLHGLRAVVLSIDDFYLSQDERKHLALTTHPLLATRGVPGTHDVNLAIECINALKTLTPEQEYAIPRFNKALDDRAARSEWEVVRGPVDVVIFEGWCVGAPPQAEDELLQPENGLEAMEDKTLAWRRFVNEQLLHVYQALFDLLDYLIVLKAPSFDCVFHWRLLQEQKLAERWRREHPDEPDKTQTPEQIKRFISHYERLTKHCLNTLPQHANLVLTLAEDHTITHATHHDA